MNQQIDRLSVALAGRYEVEREIGAGGMATVFLARDLKHQRLVAVKVLRPDLGVVLGADRFLSEIRVTANLQHPNLLPLFDSGDADGLLFYVMPYVDGESLRARLDREKQLPVAEAVRIAVAVASALDYAHRHGVIHRDLKPENILLHDGQPIVADFGIALAVSNAGGNRITQTGLSLGTPQYMSPEQATGDRQLDARSDIYSLGAVTYEMLAGDPPHTASSAQAVIAKVLTEKPIPVRTLRDAVPANVEYAVERALAKLPADRWGSAREFIDALEGRVAFTASERYAQPGRLRWLPWATTGFLAIACAALVVRSRMATSSSTASAHGSRFSISSVGDDRARIERAAISPDGQTIAISARIGDSLALWLRRLDELAPRRLLGSDGGTTPFFSPDGRWVGFVGVDGIIRKLPIEGGTPTPLGRIAEPLGIAWVTPDTIVAGMLAMSRTPGLTRLLASGAETSTLTAPARAMHHWPIATPDGRSAIFTELRNESDVQPAIISLGTGRYQHLKIPGVPVAISFGYLEGRIFFQDTTYGVWSLPVDLGAQRATGPAMRVDAGQRFQGASELRLAQNGTLVYTHTDDRVALVMNAASAHPDTAVLDSWRDMKLPRWSPDGQAVAGASVWSEPGLYVVDRRSHTVTRITRWRSDLPPAWSADGARLTSTRRETSDSVVWWFARDGQSAPERLVTAPSGWRVIECAPSPDGRLVAMELERDSTRSVYVSPAGGGPADAKLVAASGHAPRWSPDGNWIVYEADVSGRIQIFAQRYPTGGLVQLSDGGATHPVWSRSGKSIYYESGQDIMRTDLDVTSSGLHVQRRERVWRGDRTSERGDAPFTNYDVSPTGELAVFGLSSTGRSEVVVELNWASTLRRVR